MPPRLLIVEDEPAIHDCLRRGLEAAADPLAATVECVQHGHGPGAVADVEAALAADRPFAAAFIDARSTTAVDVRETARRFRLLDADITLVIVAGDSGLFPAEIGRVAGPADKIVYLFEPIEEAQIGLLAVALGRRWAAERELAKARAALRRQTVQLEEQAAALAANERRANHLASHDALTGAPNRLAFQEALAARVRQPGQFAVAMVDLDRFKLVNDTLGHLAGDEMIRGTCSILQSAVPDGGLVARLGGDEFGLLFDTAGADAAAMVCDRLVAACHVPMRVIDDPVHGSVSAGVVVADEGTRCDPVDLMRCADLALNDAKRSGRNVARLFDASFDENNRIRRQIEGGLSHAIARDELGMAFQPIVANGTFEVVGFEALLRWHAEEFGSISPATFIPIAEESNLIHELGDWVLAKSLEALKDWPGQYVSVNFSPRQFRRHNFVGYVMEQVQRARIEPSRLQIEITETAILDDAERAAETLYRLRQMGFRIALDDFGAGYSSLYNIRKFPLDSLKIDRSFIDGMGRERESAAVVHSIIYLGRALGLGVIAEGVETELQVAMLRAAGASHLQGYLFARPLSAEDARVLAVAGFIDGYADEDASLETGTNG